MNLSEEKQIEFTLLAIKDILQKTKKETLKIEFDLSHKPTIFESKFSGIGYVPHNSEIPVNSKNQQLRLLAQLECDKIGLENFPKKGLLQFWTLDDDLTGADFDNPTNQDGFRIIYHEEVDKTVTEEEISAKIIPLDDESYFPIDKEVALRFVKIDDSISFGDCHFDSLFAEAFNKLSPDETIEGSFDLDIDLWDIDNAEIKDFTEDSGWGHKINGFPSFTQQDPRDENDDFDTLLLQIDSGKIDDSHEILWGDCGICNFFINSEKLKNCDFSEVIYNWDCC